MSMSPAAAGAAFGAKHTFMVKSYHFLLFSTIGINVEDNKVFLLILPVQDAQQADYPAGNNCCRDDTPVPKYINALLSPQGRP